MQTSLPLQCSSFPMAPIQRRNFPCMVAKAPISFPSMEHFLLMRYFYSLFPIYFVFLSSGTRPTIKYMGVKIFSFPPPANPNPPVCSITCVLHVPLGANLTNSNSLRDAFVRAYPNQLN
mmetsp:Transcript_10414/g.19970  ORF Transcript_10414/g.19970 Transcript_10414/m.19970 type:complete len:119 (-) Transcript_10414:235-591(-)